MLLHEMEKTHKQTRHAKVEASANTRHLSLRINTNASPTHLITRQHPAQTASPHPNKSNCLQRLLVLPDSFTTHPKNRLLLLHLSRGNPTPIRNPVHDLFATPLSCLSTCPGF